MLAPRTFTDVKLIGCRAFDTTIGPDVDREGLLMGSVDDVMTDANPASMSRRATPSVSENNASEFSLAVCMTFCRRSDVIVKQFVADSSAFRLRWLTSLVVQLIHFLP